MSEEIPRRLPSFVKFAVAGAAVIAAGSYWLRSRRRIDFVGKRVLIAGGSRGLGLELARLFAKESARIILLARHHAELAESKRELEQLGAAVIAVPCDVSNEREVHSAVARVVGEMGAIDILVNNAGVIQVGPPRSGRSSRRSSRFSAWPMRYRCSPPARSAPRGRSSKPAATGRRKSSLRPRRALRAWSIAYSPI